MPSTSSATPLSALTTRPFRPAIHGLLRTSGIKRQKTRVGAHDQAKELLLWIVDKVIKERQTKAFLLEAGTRDPLIDFLYDERVLHVLRKGMSAKDEPGKRFHVYGIDYGCYVDLINTAKAPRGLLDLGEGAPEFSAGVPKSDFRSIRRCVLNLDDFYTRNTEQRART